MIITAQRRFAPMVIGIDWNTDRHQIGISDRHRWNTHPDGRISLPLANELEASGKTAVELQQEITTRLSTYVVHPVVNVMVKQVNSLKISVLGEVRRPDVYRLKNRVTVLDAIAMAGGFTDLARPNKVIVLRNTPDGPQRIKINIKQLVANGSDAPVYLQTLDTVYVE